ncbi:Pantothenate transporter [Rasamsonia emersonii CBS 393.64]|uniref:Pantothenate transporter n=1 Tax=Rasamsonia emersonii (strain ATCC 16479 / CBS 393.64 / IMI 116815) TaxID=1408163 RepID=A0A0F4YQW6_RASE3|nr:Pantothenate transporter [Rasamsonia emersonii CBS 393.64]KKA20500.1 Pantothenate transporter [Rasamsonia emersonii CBS 393.64]
MGAETTTKTAIDRTSTVESVEAGDIIQKELKKPKLVSYLWDTFDKPPEERKLLFKLDAAILSFASIGYFVKSIDSVNINSAFVSGMKEDLGLYKNQLNYMHTAWAIGYMLGQLPSNIILTRTRPRYWIPSLEVIWSILTIALSKCNKPYQFYVIRFFIGGLSYSIKQRSTRILTRKRSRREWLLPRYPIYDRLMVPTRRAREEILHRADLQLHRIDDVGVSDGWGVSPGWRGLFLVDGAISLPMALGGYFILPDVPEITKSWYLTKREISLAQKRMELEGRKPRAKYTKAKIKRMLSSWRIYLLSFLYLTFSNGNGGSQPVFQQYLRHSTHPKYSITQINTYPTTTSAVQIAMIIIYAWSSDTILRGRRWPALVFGGMVNVICHLSLAVWDIPTWWKWTCFIAVGAGHAVGGLCMAWANEICEDDSEERAITLASMHEVAYIVQIWLPLIVWQQVDAPRYHKGFITATAMSGVMIVVCFVVRALNKRDVARKRMQEAVETEAEAEAQGEGSKSESNEELPPDHKKEKEKQKEGQSSEVNLTKTSTQDRHINRAETDMEAEAAAAIEMEEVVRPAKMC